MSERHSPVPANTVEGDADFQRRLRSYARAMTIAFVALFLASLLTHVFTRGEFTEGHSTVPHHLMHLTALLIPLGAWLLCRRSTQLRKRTLEHLDVAVTLGMSWLLTLMGTTGTRTTFGIIIAFSMIIVGAYIVVGRSIAVPSTRGRTLWISALAIAPTSAFFILRQARFTFPDRRIENIFIVFSVGWLVFAVLVAAASSRQLFGLRKTIQEIGKLGQYTLDAKIGEGGMGAVYRATHAMLRRPAAIKLLPADRSSPADVARFEREVQLTTQLSHPNTISIFDYGRTPEGVFYYAMELLDGVDLDQLVHANGPLDPPRAIHLLAQICGSLAEAHARGLVHRDIKPANIVVTERIDEPDVIKVLDFGLVRTLDREQSVSSSTTLVGTPLYLAPEAITSPQDVDARADLYAVGAVAYYLVTGTQVFQAATVVEMCSKHLAEAPRPPSERLGRPLPADLEDLILRCLAKARDDRPASAAELRAALLACADASRYDRAEAVAWWNERGSALRMSSRTKPASGTAPTMAIDLRARRV